MSKLDHRPNDKAVKTQWGWQNSETGELLVSAVGAFSDDIEADSALPNSPSNITIKSQAAKKPKAKPQAESKQQLETETTENIVEEVPSAPPPPPPPPVQNENQGEV